MEYVKRGSERKRMNYPATIYRKDRTVLCGCMVRDISETGAKLEIEVTEDFIASSVPREFFLSFTARKEVLSDSLDVVRCCQLVWSKKDEVGVKFLRPKKPA